MNNFKDKENQNTNLLPIIKFKTSHVEPFIKNTNVHIQKTTLSNIKQISKKINKSIQRYRCPNSQLVREAKIQSQYFQKQPLKNVTFVNTMITKYSKNKNALINRNSEEVQHLQKLLGLKTLSNLTSTDLKINEKYFCFLTKHLNLFNYSGIFPIVRYGCSLVAFQDKIYLYGGYSYKGQDDLTYFHFYNPNTYQWSSVQLNKKDKIFSPCYHTSETYKNYILFIGGISINAQQNKREYNNDINAFNMQKRQWQLIKFNVHLRCHASTLFSNTLVIYGGINGKQEYSNSIHFIIINSNKLSSPLTLTLQVPITHNSINYEGLAYHKIISVYQDEDIKNKSGGKRQNQLLLFGGKDKEGRMNNEVHVFQIKNFAKSGVNKKWQILQTKGSKPCSRIHHSMNLIKKKQFVLIMAGTSGEEKVLNDAWILQLRLKTWIEVSLKTHPFPNGITNHCAAQIGTKIFIYGGIKDKNDILNTFLSIETDQYAFKSSKQITNQSNITNVSCQQQSSHSSIENQID